MLVRRPLVRELLVVLAFCLFTALLTWPYVTRLRDAVVDPGDPYLTAWILWWDYHATFTDPLNLFHANLFYPFRYTLAFSEHSYGTALLFFPLFALGLRPLTVQVVALFFGFVFSGYGAFRLVRTLTNSTPAGWVAGIIFAFIPFRFNTMSQLPYVFTAWMPLLFEALVLFIRSRSWGRAAWLGFAFLMSGLNTISWHVLSLVPFVLSAAILLTRHQLWRDRSFWLRGGVSLAAGSLLLLPFTWPYLKVSKLYGFERSVEEIRNNSAELIHWFSVEGRNKLWSRMGDSNLEGGRFKLFPGLLPIMFSLAGILLVRSVKGPTAIALRGPSPRRWLKRLDMLIVVAFALSILAVGFDRSDAFGGLFKYITSERILTLLTVSLVARLCLAYPEILPARHANLIETLRSSRRCDAFSMGLVLTVVGFCYSLGWNFFFYRICYDLFPFFRSMRVANRGAMVAYLGLAILSGLGVKRLVELIRQRRPWLRQSVLFAVACLLLLIELNAAPLKFMRGEVFPDAVTLRLKETSMRGGIVMLPAGPDFNHRYVLRSADHMKPLIVGTSGFDSPYEEQIEIATRSGPISRTFMDLLEKIPTSYIVVHNGLLPPERRSDIRLFLTWALAAKRLRFVNRFDAKNDLYAVTANEPEAISEAAPPEGPDIGDWASLIDQDPLTLLAREKWSLRVCRIHIATYGDLPKHSDFVSDMKSIGSGLILDVDQDTRFENNLRKFAEEWTRRPGFRSAYGNLDDVQYVERVIANLGAPIDPSQRDELVKGLSTKQETRGSVLLKLADDKRFVEKEHNRLFVLLHYFSFLRRNPYDPPDHNLDGLNFWVQKLEKNPTSTRISAAFAESIEYGLLKRNQ